jgi:hypothetical protein
MDEFHCNVIQGRISPSFGLQFERQACSMLQVMRITATSDSTVCCDWSM